eukprot:2673622-Pyramimonas_sp.AAC.1
MFNNNNNNNNNKNSPARELRRAAGPWRRACQHPTPGQPATRLAVYVCCAGHCGARRDYTPNPFGAS